MPAKTAADQYVDLALDQFVQSGWLQHPQTDVWMRAAKRRQIEAAQVDAAIDRQLPMQCACRLQLRGGVRNVAKPFRDSGQIGLTDRGEDELLVQPLEQLHAEGASSALTCCPTAAGVTCSSCAASLKLRCRAVASKARSALRGGRA